MKKYFPLYPHNKINNLFDGVYSVTGSMRLFKSFRYSRNMVILKEGEKLCLVNPIRLEKSEEQKLLELGKIHSILKLGRLHSVDIPYYMDQFSPALWASSKDDFVIKNNLKIHTDIEETSQFDFLDLEVYSFQTSKENEAVAFLPQDNGILLACDALVNMGPEDPYANWLVKKLSKFLPKPTLIGPNWIKVMKPKKSDFDEVLKYDFKTFIPAHGPGIFENAKEILTAYIEDYNFK